MSRVSLGFRNKLFVLRHASHKSPKHALSINGSHARIGLGTTYGHGIWSHTHTIQSAVGYWPCVDLYPDRRETGSRYQSSGSCFLSCFRFVLPLSYDCTITLTGSSFSKQMVCVVLLFNFGERGKSSIGTTKEFGRFEPCCFFAKNRADCFG